MSKKVASFARFIMPTLLLGLLIGLGVGWAAAGRSVNAEEGGANETPSSVTSPSGQTYYKRMAGLSFIPRSSSTTFTTGQPGCLVRVDSAGQDYFVYDLQLP